ncbi:SpaH/EbpB family LPXTG-anchored major pilin [Enterococcus sp. 669A]|uniref:SpaH/EbpB family LPXTG-anchored major pilin n=1 Tax=Candidatus Enterococcus moelleringii TaxID=2815325 RepID=A0ABS3L9F9_9ENTE|nr:SpaH/EbpB family LPXTG-anchored major pilin [Enterococcus sp. 669A]MBO1306230.1 SpaH/EbpB family LPXTG-anchored major pilin [Enterococcus sp. 669A]
MKSNKRKIVRLAMTAALLASVGTGLGSLALGNGVEADAVQNISTNPVADETSERSLTIWKYQVKDASELGGRGDGKEETVTKDPLEGIKFRIQKVTPVSGVSLVNPLVQKETTHYTIDSTVGTITTGANGSAKQVLGTGTAADGVYLVTELPDDRGESPSVAKPADPFFVYVPQTDRSDLSSLIYDVEVQPKNIMESLIDPVKTVNEGEAHSIKAGVPFTWEATANLPSGLYTVAAQDMVITPVYDEEGNQVADITVEAGEGIHANYFRINDTLVKELLLDNVVAQVKTETGDWTNLVFGTDYKVFVNGTEQTTAPVTDATDAEKVVRVELTRAGMEKVATNNDTKIRVVYTTHTANDYNGTISNSFNVDFLTPGLEPVTPKIPDGSEPKYYTGGFDIEKTAEDKAAPDNKLAGAEFHIAANEADAKAGKFIASDGKSYVKADLPTDVTFLTATTTADGRAEFNGLALKCYEDKNNNGKQDLTDDPETNEPTFATADIKQDYWVVETKAPSGYELLKAPQKVTVDLSTADDTLVELNVVDKPTTDLPFTGGEGTMLLVAIALGAITIGTVAIVIDKRRRAA